MVSGEPIRPPERARACASGSSRPLQLDELYGVRAETLPVRRGINIFQLDLPAQHLLFPCLVFGLVRLELWHHLLGKELEAFADVFVRVLARLVE